MPNVRDICDFLETLAPNRLAEEWDNVGLLVGNATHQVDKVMTCLTVTPTTVAEAVREKASVLITHHPLPFRPLKRITSESNVGRMLLDLIANNVAIYSAHTAYDSATLGMNAAWAEAIELTNVRPLSPLEDDPDELGAGRVGEYAEPIAVTELADRLKRFHDIGNIKTVGDADRLVSRVALACGSAGGFLSNAISAGCDVFITGETTFHTCLEAEAAGVSLMLVGHYASERFGMEQLAAALGEEFSDVAVWCSRDEADPITWL